MDFDHIFENRKKQRNNLVYSNYSKTQNTKQTPFGFDNYSPIRTLISPILNNRKLRVAILIGIVFIIGILIALIAILFPLIKNLVAYLLENGVSGIVDEVVVLLEKLWNGK